MHTRAAGNSTQCIVRETTTMNVSHGFGAPLYLMLAWLAGCILWNVGGVIMVSRGGPGIGPTASLGLAGGLFIAAIALVIAARRSRIAFIILSALFGLMGLAAVYQAVTGDPSLWPSPFWRWAGAALNLFGFGAGLLGVIRGTIAK